MKLALSLLSGALLIGLFACGSGTESTGTTGGAAGHGAGGTGAGGTSTGGTSTGGTGGCRSQADCDGAAFCAAYTLPPLCGGMEDVTFNDNCTTDADCADAGTGQICDATLCWFPKGGAQPGLHCRAGCSVAADCGPGFACSAAHHCEAASCAQPSDCGKNHTCTAGTCGATPCTTDAQCDDFCVNGFCSATNGVCQEAVP